MSNSASEDVDSRPARRVRSRPNQGFDQPHHGHHEPSELQAGLQIRRNQLDEELMRQPQLFYQAGEAYALAFSRLEEAKAAVKQVAAELYLRLRRKLSDKEKPTESMIHSHVESHEEHVVAKVRLAEAHATLEDAEALKDAYAQRAWMLRELCGLQVSGFFSQNSVQGPDARAVGDAAAERQRIAMDEKRRRGLSKTQ